jgi:hypothetical protein
MPQHRRGSSPHPEQDDQRPAAVTVLRARRRQLSVASVGIITAAVAAAAIGIPSVTASAATTLGPNLVVNGAGEQDTAGWVTRAPGKLSSVAGRSGKALRVTNAGTTASTVALNDKVNTVASTVAGTKYTVQAWVRTASPKVTTQLRLREVKAGALVQSDGPHVWIQDTAWHKLSFSFTAKSTGGSLDLNVVGFQLRPKQSFDVDDVVLAAELAASPTPTATTATATTTSTPTSTTSTTTTPATSTTSSTTSPTSTSTTTSPAPTSSATCTINAKLVPSCGALWGMYTTTSTGTDWATPFTTVESKIGRKFDLVKRYHDWSNAGGSGQFPDASERQLGANGQRILYFSWVSKNWSAGTTASWADIAAGKYDESVIKPQAQRLKDWAQPVFLDFDHEMDGKTRTGNGTTDDYVRAYRHIRDVVVKAGATNVVWVWMPTGTMGNLTRIKAMYPGDAYVDWVGYDPYNFYTCNGSGWETPTQTLKPYYDWLHANGLGDKPIMLGEYGSIQDSSNPQRAGDWYAGVTDALKGLPDIKAVVQWNSSTSTKCDFRVTQASNLLEGFVSSGKDPYVNVR